MFSCSCSIPRGIRPSDLNRIIAKYAFRLAKFFWEACFFFCLFNSYFYVNFVISFPNSVVWFTQNWQQRYLCTYSKSRRFMCCNMCCTTNWYDFIISAIVFLLLSNLPIKPLSCMTEESQVLRSMFILCTNCIFP